MDIGKLKVARLLIVGISLLIAGITNAQDQYDIPVYITTSEPVDTTQSITFKPDVQVDFDYQLIDTAYRWAYGGFNNLLVDDRVLPVHFEEFDDFNVAYFKSDSTVNLIYSGAQGALKNDFLFQRFIAFEEYGKQSGLLEQSTEDLTNSLDSITSVWTKELNTYPFTELFKRDEKMFYESFRNFALYAQKLILSGTSDFTEAKLADFPKMNFNSNRYYTTIPLYRELAKAYHYRQILNDKSVGQARRYVNRLDGYSQIDDLKNLAFLKSTEHHPNADLLYRISKPQYEPHTSERRRLNRKRRRNEVGDDFEMPESYTLDKQNVDFNNLYGKKVYVFIYYLNDPQLRDNLQQWKGFYTSKIKEDAYFIALAMDSDLNLELWKSLQFDSQIAGWNITTSLRKAFQYRKDIGMALVPRVVAVDEEGIITDPNVDVGFKKSAFK
jgi:hypothetical protein